ncbi:MAG: carbamoyltransferase HypF, partial [Sutterellaceae bacterium]|nr:carbamoyltransferase HypF [Sutterellaceae bacterium]
PAAGDTSFRIEESREGRVTTAITPDAATCVECARDMFTPGNRRYRYAFTNCTHCGPRFTITRHLPYDRPQTSMANFEMCPECLEEYRDPLDRRFHAQPNACPKCGPRLFLWTSEGEPVESADPIETAVKLIREGKIVAVKGLGGFHLVCDAENREAVARLRARKRRDEKPLAVMMANVASARRYVTLSPEEEKVLTSIARPIVLAKKTPECDERLPGVAPGLSELGVMLPYTPVHLLLFHEAAGRPDGVEWLQKAVVPMTLVMTSANPGGEPLVIGNREALRRLGSIADHILANDREILIRCDDSVVRVVAGAPRMVRRARGYTPLAVPLKLSGPSVLATGPGLKVTACLTRGNEAFLSQHIGDLANASSCRALELAVEHLEEVLEISPKAVAHDMHPDFFSTRLAREVSSGRGIPSYSVQHHRAHIGAVMAEYGITGPARGIALDGVGLGTDGEAWGGEMLDLGAAGFVRTSHLEPLALPGGDRAAREPWRMAASVLESLGRGDEIERRFEGIRGASMIRSLIRNSRLTGTTTAMGRYFDAASSLLGLCHAQHDEATAAMRLESAAEGAAPRDLGTKWEILPDGTLSLLPLMNEIADRPHDPDSVRQASADFHEGLARALTAWIEAHSVPGDRRPLLLSGGCFLNRRLSTRLIALLEKAGIRPLLGSKVPPGDGGVALGEAWCCGLAIREFGIEGLPPGDTPDFGRQQRFN